MLLLLLILKIDILDFIEEIGKIERLISSAEQPKTLADIYPPEMQSMGTSEVAAGISVPKDTVTLYDVLYACVTAEAPDGR